MRSSGRIAVSVQAPGMFFSHPFAHPDMDTGISRTWAKLLTFCEFHFLLFSCSAFHFILFYFEYRKGCKEFYAKIYFCCGWKQPYPEEHDFNDTCHSLIPNVSQRNAVQICYAIKTVDSNLAPVNRIHASQFEAHDRNHSVLVVDIINHPTKLGANGKLNETIEFYLITIIIEIILFSGRLAVSARVSDDSCNKLRDH